MNIITQQGGASASRIHMGEWYIGMYVDESGDLAIYIDNEYGKVEVCDNDIAEDGDQWACMFKSARRSWMRHSTWRKVKVRINK